MANLASISNAIWQVPVKYNSNSVRINNNCLKSVARLPSVLNSILINPAALGWLDLSFNELTTIEEVSDVVRKKLYLVIEIFRSMVYSLANPYFLTVHFLSWKLERFVFACESDQEIERDRQTEASSTTTVRSPLDNHKQDNLQQAELLHYMVIP